MGGTAFLVALHSLWTHLSVALKGFHTLAMRGFKVLLLHPPSRTPFKPSSDLSSSQGLGLKPRVFCMLGQLRPNTSAHPSLNLTKAEIETKGI